GDNSRPSRAAFKLVSAALSAALSLSRCILIWARSALSADRSPDLMRRLSLRAAYLASSLVRRFIARVSARRDARVLRVLNRPIRGSPPGRLVDAFRLVDLQYRPANRPALRCRRGRPDFTNAVFLTGTNVRQWQGTEVPLGQGSCRCSAVTLARE